MNVLFISAESVPFAKVGGMADVVGSLPSALREEGLDARVMLPGYGFIDHNRYNISLLFSFQITMREGPADIRVYTTIYEGIPFYFIQVWPYFGTEQSVYTQYEWDMPRFIYFSRVAMAAMWEIKERLGWWPDVAHVNDWHTGLISFLIKESQHQHEWAQMATVMSIHNLAYQGNWAGGFLFVAGVAGRDQSDLVYQDLTDNLMAISIAYSDMVTTVSPRYATEIQYDYMGYGLEGLIRTRLPDLHGILNGIDTEMWNPETDTKIIAQYNSETFSELRIYNKRHLQSQAGLPVRDEAMIIGLVSRLVWQKGIDLAMPALRQILSENNDIQLVVLGTGDPELEQEVWQLQQDFPDKVRAYLEFDAAVAQQIYAGCDVFLMPSHFEPCGIGQMMAMRYGALPLVRETGGLADTVQNFDNADGDSGTGFVFSWEESDAILGTMRWVFDTFRNKPAAWEKMQKRAMERDFSWASSAKQYIDIYKKAIQRRRSN